MEVAEICMLGKRWRANGKADVVVIMVPHPKPDANNINQVKEQDTTS